MKPVSHSSHQRQNRKIISSLLLFFNKNEFIKKHRLQKFYLKISKLIKQIYTYRSFNEEHHFYWIFLSFICTTNLNLEMIIDFYGKIISLVLFADWTRRRFTIDWRRFSLNQAHSMFISSEHSFREYSFRSASTHTQI